MDFPMIGTVTSYANMQKMETKWRRGDADKQDDAMSLINDDDKENSGNDSTLRNITDKLNRGGRLTSAEKQYLQKKDPQTYSRVLNMEREQADYERRLKQCRTKDEVQRLKMSRIGASLSTVNSVKNNPHITEEKKLEIITQEQQRSAAMEKIEAEFAKNGELSQLPTNAEKDIAEKKLAEAEQVDNSEKVENAGKIVKSDDNSDKPEKAADVKRKPTKAEVEQLPEVKKTKRVKNRVGPAFGDPETFKSLNVKA